MTELMTITRLHQLAITYHFIPADDPLPSVPTEITVQEHSPLPAPDVTDELGWMSVEAWKRGNEPLLRFVKKAQEWHREKTELERKATEHRKFMERLLDLAYPGPTPKAGFAKLKAAEAKKAAAMYFDAMLYLHEKLEEALHG